MTSDGRPRRPRISSIKVTVRKKRRWLMKGEKPRRRHREEVIAAGDSYCPTRAFRGLLRRKHLAHLMASINNFPSTTAARGRGGALARRARFHWHGVQLDRKPAVGLAESRIKAGISLAWHSPSRLLRLRAPSTSRGCRPNAPACERAPRRLALATLGAREVDAYRREESHGADSPAVQRLGSSDAACSRA